MQINFVLISKQTKKKLFLYHLSFKKGQSVCKVSAISQPAKAYFAFYNLV